MIELKVTVDLYLKLKDNETEDEAQNRLFGIIEKAANENKGFVMSQIYKSKVQQY